jgi:hypothetical protein
MTATRTSWKQTPFVDGVPVPFAAAYSRDEYERLREGVVPGQMEDKWFIFFEEPFLFFHRSWTGQPVYRVRLVESASGYRAEEAAWAGELASGNEDQVPYQAALLNFLVDNFLLGRSTPFPRPPGLQEQAPGVFQHHVAGTGFPETEVKGRRPWWRFWKKA